MRGLRATGETSPSRNSWKADSALAPLEALETCTIAEALTVSSERRGEQRSLWLRMAAKGRAGVLPASAPRTPTAPW
eukprot:3263911-Pleurochrysis_carterae.AAC.1